MDRCVCFLQGGFELVVWVTDEDGGGSSEAVDVLVVSVPTGVRPGTRFTSSLVVRGEAGRGFLRYNYRLSCTEGYSGERCNIREECGTGLCTDCKSHLTHV